jgi:hypothetical protein
LRVCCLLSCNRALLFVYGAASNARWGQISHLVNELLDFAEDMAGALFPALKNRHPACGHANFFQQRFDGLGAFVCPQVALEVAALVLFAGHNRHTIRAGFKRLDQIRNIHLPGTGQTDGLDGVALQAVAKAGKLVGRQIIGAIKNVRFQSSLVHKTYFFFWLKNQLSRLTQPESQLVRAAGAVTNWHMLHIFLTKR